MNKARLSLSGQLVSLKRRMRGGFVRMLLFMALAMAALLLFTGEVRAEEPVTRVMDINPDAGSSSPAELTNVNGTLFFNADDGENGIELWKSDGTPEGTELVKDIIPGIGSSQPIELTNVNGTLFFSAYDGAGENAKGRELWKSNGMEAGTVMVRDIYDGGISSAPAELTNVNGILYFSANDGTNGRELWKFDKTEQDAVPGMVKDVNPGEGSSAPAELTNVNGILYFSADDGANGRELWKFDETEPDEVPVMVKNIIPGGGSSSPIELTNVDGTLFFRANNGFRGFELYKSDGTAAGTVRVKDIQPGSGSSSSSPAELTNVNGTLFFSADDGTNGRELWKSDGTEAGTVLLMGLYPAGGSSSPAELTNVNGTLFFSADNGTRGIELWKSDGTEAGTVLVKDIQPGSGSSSSPRNLTVINSTLFFSADDGTSGTELWMLNNFPTVSPIYHQSRVPGESIVIDFTVNDVETSPDQLIFTVVSSDQSVLPDGNIILGGDHYNRTITLSPESKGLAEVTITVSDGLRSTEITFKAAWRDPIRVPSDGLFDISSAVSAALAPEMPDGQIILIEEGEYVGPGNRDINLGTSKHVTIKSETGPENTIIDLEYSGRAFTLPNGSTLTLEGITIMNGFSEEGGGAIFGDDSSLVIKDSTFIRNHAKDAGGAVSVNYSGPGNRGFEISGSTFSQNSSERGGAVAAGTSGDTTHCVPGDGTSSMRNNTFNNNTARFGEAVFDQGFSVISSSAFLDNEGFSEGGAVNTINASIKNSAFLKNTSGNKGGAVFTRFCTDVSLHYTSTIIYSTFAGNEALEQGGAVYAGEDMEISNSILWGNRADDSGDQIYLSGTELEIESSDLQGGLGAVEGSSFTVTSPGVIDVDPQFAFDDELHLMPDSPCIDAGVDLVDDQPDMNGPAPGDFIGPAPDMGAFEFDPDESPVIAVSPSRFIFTAREGDPLAEGQTLYIRNREIPIGESSDFDWEISDDIAWLRVEVPVSAVQDGSFAVRLYPDHNGLTHGVHASALTITKKEDTAVLATVDVTLYVTRDLYVKEGTLGPYEYGTIQDAIDAAIEGDTVLVANGTYTGEGNTDLDFLGKGITVRSENSPVFTTVDCGGSGRAFFFRRAETLRSIVQGFTFKNCDNGIFIEPAHKLKIDQNKLQNCRSNILNLVNVL